MKVQPVSWEKNRVNFIVTYTNVFLIGIKHCRPLIERIIIAAFHRNQCVFNKLHVVLLNRNVFKCLKPKINFIRLKTLNSYEI